MAAITAIATEALVLDEDAHAAMSTYNENAEKVVYAKAFQVWADGRLEGTAGDIFEAVQEVLEI